MSTPRTDAAIQQRRKVMQNQCITDVSGDFARQLERELASVQSDLSTQVSVTLGQIQTIRDLRERVSKAEAVMMGCHAGYMEIDKAIAAWREDAVNLSEHLRSKLKRDPNWPSGN